jgi:hypothetical protein
VSDYFFPRRWLELPDADLSAARAEAKCHLDASRSASGKLTRSESASLIGHLGSSTFRLPPPPQCRRRSRARASLRNRHQGPSIMGFEDEAEQSFSRPCRQQDQADSRTHLIHRPARDILPLLGGSRFSPIGFDPELFSCCCHGLLPGPPELGAVNPYSVHDHRQPACQGHDRLLHPAAPGDLHGPGLEP